MLGQHAYHPAPCVVDMESLVPKHHFLRKVDRVIDFTFVRRLTERCYCANNGRPSIDPEIFFRMVFISYFYGIDSDRELCEQVQYNLAYRWFCRLSLGDSVPDHSSMTRIRDRIGENNFKLLFEKIVCLCQEKGLAKGKSVMTDGTLVAANASLNSLVPKEGAEIPKDFVKPAFAPPLKRKLSNETHISRTDPDATLAKKEGSPRALKYKIHNSIDAKSRVILDTHVTTGAVHESQVYLERLDHIQNAFGIIIHEAVADRGYGSGEIIANLQGRFVRTFIPLFNSRSGTALVPEGFQFEKEKDRFLCPEGNYLEPFATAQKGVKIYRGEKENCGSCLRKQTCLAGSSKPTKRISRSVHTDLFKRVLSEMETELFQRKLSERMWKMEGIIAEAKNHHGLNRARYRRRAKVQIQAYLTATVQNIKRLVRAFGEVSLNGPKTLLRAVEFLVFSFAFGAGRRAGATQKVPYFQ